MGFGALRNFMDKTPLGQQLIHQKHFSWGWLGTSTNTIMVVCSRIPCVVNFFNCFDFVSSHGQDMAPPWWFHSMQTKQTGWFLCLPTPMPEESIFISQTYLMITSGMFSWFSFGWQSRSLVCTSLSTPETQTEADSFPISV